jgi:hypothetical protein
MAWHWPDEAKSPVAETAGIGRELIPKTAPCGTRQSGLRITQYHHPIDCLSLSQHETALLIPAMDSASDQPAISY